MADELDFFVSYTGQDVNWATWVAAALEGEGYRVIVQEWDFQVGNFMSQMEDAVQRARYLLPVLSEAYLKSKYARMEWTAYAKADPSKIIPIQIEDIETRSILDVNVRVNLLGLTEHEATERLTARIRQCYGKPRDEPRQRFQPFFPGLAPKISTDPAGGSGRTYWSTRSTTAGRLSGPRHRRRARCPSSPSGAPAAG